jgi:hypothetical protein
MTYAGVDRAVLQAGGAYGAMTEYNAFVQRQHPAKFTGLMHVDEAMAGGTEALAEIERAHRTLGLKGIYYNADGLSRHSFPWDLDDAKSGWRRCTPSRGAASGIIPTPKRRPSSAASAISSERRS